MNIDWHERFIQQALWTKAIRDYLIEDLPIPNDAAVLEVGCGTGVVLSDLVINFRGRGFGIDIDFYRTIITTRNYGFLDICNSDASSLPFPSSTFELVFCHYFLLWLAEPTLVLQEAFRVTKPGGFFIAFAEPDYDNRIDTPHTLSKLGALQSHSLRKQGAYLGVGRDLAKKVAGAGFRLLKFGVPGYERPDPGIPSWWESEWLVINQDLEGLVTQEELVKYQEIDRQSWLSGDRVLWVPTYYALGVKP